MMRPTTLTDLATTVRELMDSKGFSADQERIWELLLLVHTEISEAAEAYRRGEPHDEVGRELTDALIRVLHLLTVLDQDPDALFDEVMARNRMRPFRWNTVRGG